MGIYPAWQSSRADLIDGLKEGGRGTQRKPRQQRFRRILVGAQVALSVSLLAGAALAHRQFRPAKSTDRSDSDSIISGLAFISSPQARYPDQASRGALRRTVQEMRCDSRGRKRGCKR